MVLVILGGYPRGSRRTSVARSRAADARFAGSIDTASASAATAAAAGSDRRRVFQRHLLRQEQWCAHKQKHELQTNTKEQRIQTRKRFVDRLKRYNIGDIFHVDAGDAPALNKNLVFTPMAVVNVEFKV